MDQQAYLSAVARPAKGFALTEVHLHVRNSHCTINPGNRLADPFIPVRD